MALAALVVFATGCAVGDPAGAAPVSSAPSSASPTASTWTSTSAKPSPVRTATNPKLRAELLTMLAADHKDRVEYLAELAKICAQPQ